MKILIIIGAPGSGKGTISYFLVEKYNFCHVSTGKIFRDLNQNQKNSTANKGLLVSDDTTNNVLKEHLEKLKETNDNWIILDGYPRTLNQAEFLFKHFSVESVFYLDEIEDQIILDRLSNRYICKQHEHIFNKQKTPSIINGLCPIDGSELFQREDDKLEIAKKRLEIFKQSTLPLIEFFEKKGKLLRINGNKESEEIVKDILKLIKHD